MNMLTRIRKEPSGSRFPFKPKNLRRAGAVVLVLLFGFYTGAIRMSAATNYYVDKNNPSANDSHAGTNPTQPWRTLGKAALTAVAGDTVTVIGGGIYDERVSPSNSGTAGNPIRFIAGAGTQPKVRGWSLAGKRYIVVSGFEVTNAGMSPDSGMSFLVSGSDHIEVANNYIHDTYGIAVRASVFDGGKATNLIVRNNRMAFIGPPGNRVVIIQCYCSSTLIEGNDMSHGEDFVQIWGNHNVMRNNNTHDGVASDTSGNRHLDAYQSYCFNSTAETMNYVLIENNVHANNPSSHDHFVINNQTDICGGSTTVIVRYNLVNLLGSAPFSMDLNHSGDYADNWKIYNNTVNNSTYNGGGTKALHHAAVLNATTAASLLNNIFVDAIAASSPAQMYVFKTGDSTSKGDYNLAYMSGGSITWASPIANEPHALLNRNPLFVGGNDFRLQAGSPARGSGGPLTTVASTDSGSGTTLRVVDAHFFQDGWAGVAPDQIAIGAAGNTAQISSINYSTNTITLATSISRSPGQPVSLFRNSSGTQVLYSAVDLGAFPYTPSGTDTIAPSISLTAPGSGATVSGASVTVAATASDNVGVVAVQFKLDGVNLGTEDTATPYSITWNTTTASNGSHALTAVARDAAGNQATSAPITVSVSNLVVDTTPPSIAMAAPTSGSTVSGNNVTIAANASDNVGVVGVQFKLDGVNLGAEDTATPYSIAWNTTTASNGSHALTALARDAAGNQSTSAITVSVNNPVVDATPPSIAISSPTNGSTVNGDSVTIAANASDNVGVVGVQFRLNGNNFGAEDTSSPFSINWNTNSSANGTYSLTAVARDAAGNQATSAVVSIAVNNTVSDTTAPTVSMTSPANGATVSGAGATLAATASDNVGVVGVRFRVNGNNLGAEDTSSPFSIIWNTTSTPNGTYSLTAVARDAAGNQATSATVSVTVNNDTTAPTVSISSPANGSTVSGTSVIVSAVATDNIGVVGVRFKLDGVDLGLEDTTSPYSVAWDSTDFTDDSHTITAVARDMAGNTTTSAAITVIIDNVQPTLIPYAILNLGAQTGAVTDTSTTQSTDYGRVLPDFGPMPAAEAIFGYRTGNILVSETGVPASEPENSGRIYVELSSLVKTGIALANSSNADAVVSFTFTDGAGKNVAAGSLTLPAKQQIAGFLDQSPFNGPSTMQGTFTFTSSPVPVSAIAIRGITNDRGEFLTTTLSATPLDQGLGGKLLTFPHLNLQIGWTAKVILINPTETQLTGTFQFFGQSSGSVPSPVAVRVGAVSNSRVSYTIPPRSEYHFTADASNAPSRIGSVVVTPTPNTPSPSGIGLTSYKNAQGITVSEVSVPASPSGSAFRTYVESSGIAGQIGSIRSVLSIHNTASATINLQMELRNMDGTPTGFSSSASLPAGGQLIGFIHEFFSKIPNNFRGVVRVTASGPAVVRGVRGRYNERGDLLVTAIPVSDEANSQAIPEVVFPHILSGSGYSTQLIIFSGTPGSGASGDIELLNQDGTPAEVEVLH